MKKIKHYHPLTLIELMISFGLFSIILALLFSSFRTTSLLGIKGDVGLQRVLERSRLHQRLNQVFFDAEKSSFCITEDANSGMEILNFCFNNHVDIDPLYSEMIGARLYLNKKNSIVLETFPIGDKEHLREESLLSQTHDFRINIESSSVNLTIDNRRFVFILPKTELSGFLL
jgi:hypothetical protein